MILLNNNRIIKIVVTIILLLITNNISAQEKIPFKIGKDNRIYIKGSINKSDTINLLFDLGANVTVINKTRLKQNKVQIKFDSIVPNKGTNGVSNEELSSSNSVRVGNRTYFNKEILGIAYPQEAILDGIIGGNLFKNKVVRINYESQELVVYDELPKLSNTYNKAKIKFLSGIPYIEAVVYKDKKKVKIWSMLDTGYNAVFLVYHDEVQKNKLLGKFQVIGEGSTYGTDGKIVKSDQVLLPKFEIAGFQIYNVPVFLTRTKTQTSKPALLGSNLLKRFHTVINFKKSEIYLRPNFFINSQF